MSTAIPITADNEANPENVQWNGEKEKERTQQEDHKKHRCQGHGNRPEVGSETSILCFKSADAAPAEPSKEGFEFIGT